MRLRRLAVCFLLAIGTLGTGFTVMDGIEPWVKDVRLVGTTQFAAKVFGIPPDPIGSSRLGHSLLVAFFLGLPSATLFSIAAGLAWYDRDRRRRGHNPPKLPPLSTRAQGCLVAASGVSLLIGSIYLVSAATLPFLLPLTVARQPNPDLDLGKGDLLLISLGQASFGLAAIVLAIGLFWFWKLESRNRVRTEGVTP